MIFPQKVSFMAGKGSHLLTFQDRQAIEQGIKLGLTIGTIAESIDRSHSVIKLELSRGGGRNVYSAIEAQKLADLSHRARITKLQKKIPPDIAEKIMKMAEDGLSLHRIHEATGYSCHCLKNFLKNQGIKWRGQAFKNFHERITVLEEQIAILFDLMKEKHL